MQGVMARGKGDMEYIHQKCGNKEYVNARGNGKR